MNKIINNFKSKPVATKIFYVAGIITIILAMSLLVRWANYPSQQPGYSYSYTKTLGHANCDSILVRNATNVLLKKMFKNPKFELADGVTFKKAGQGNCVVINPKGERTNYYTLVGYKFFWDFVFKRDNADVVQWVRDLS